LKSKIIKEDKTAEPLGPKPKKATTSTTKKPGASTKGAVSTSTAKKNIK